MEKKKPKKEAPKRAEKPHPKKKEEKAPKKAPVKKGKPSVAKVEKKAVTHELVDGAPKRAPEAVVAETGEKSAVVEAAGTPAVEAKPRREARDRAKPVSTPHLRLRWIRSAIAAPEKHKRIVQGLGFHRLNEIITRPDTPMIRGMVKRIPHLVEIVD
jgi:large subunit ribosomal protein L30